MNANMLKIIAERLSRGEVVDDILNLSDDAAKFALNRMANVRKGFVNPIIDTNRELSFYRSMDPAELAQAQKAGQFKIGANVNVGFPERAYGGANMPLVRFPWLEDTFDLKDDYAGAGLAAWAKSPIPFNAGQIVDNPAPLYNSLDRKTKENIMDIYMRTGRIILP